MYYKVTNSQENHNGFQYADGLNILKEPFNPVGSCVPGGFYFTTKEYIHEFYSWGIYIREIELPMGDPDFQMVRDPAGNKLRANKIILGRRHSLLDLSTYDKLALDIPTMESLIDMACTNGCVDALKKWRTDGIKMECTKNAIDLASSHGRVDILKWWSNSKMELKYSINAIDGASARCHINVLEWWKRSGLALLYSNCAIDNYEICVASRSDRINVLRWWKNSGLELRYTSGRTHSVITDCRVEFWELCNDGVSKLCCTAYIIDPVSKRITKFKTFE